MRSQLVNTLQLHSCRTHTARTYHSYTQARYANCGVQWFKFFKSLVSVARTELNWPGVDPVTPAEGLVGHA